MTDLAGNAQLGRLQAVSLLASWAIWVGVDTHWPHWQWCWPDSPAYIFSVCSGNAQVQSQCEVEVMRESVGDPWAVGFVSTSRP